MKCALFALAAVGLALTFAGDQTQAAPLAPAVSTSSNIVLAAQGCGRGWHRARYGRCVRNWSPAWACWWVRGPYGRIHMVCH
jgi:hypothetical protein